MLSLQDVLEVENDLALLDFKCPETGLLLWPLIRQELIQWTISEQLYKTASLINLSPKIHSQAKAIRSLLKAELHNLTFTKESNPILLMATGAGLITRNDKLFNRLSDYFALSRHQDTLVVEDLFNWNWPENRENGKVVYHTPIQAKTSLLSRLKVTQKHNYLAKQMLDIFAFNLVRVLGIKLPDDTYQVMHRRFSRKMAGLPVRKQLYTKLFNKFNPTLLLKEEACYGHSGIINHTAKEMGIFVAEYQHGAINAGHDAYNHGKELIHHPDYHKILPNTLLSYGEWWHQYINLPVEKQVIGNPHRTHRLSQTPISTNKNEILVLGDGVETEMYLELAAFLAANLRDYRIVFRPHPLERQRLTELSSLITLGKLKIDTRLDIYDSFRNAHVVINEVSTGLFEAVGLVDRVLIWDTPKSRFYFPVHPFESFANKEELLSKIQDLDLGQIVSTQAEKIWASDWEKNYQRFLEEHL